MIVLANGTIQMFIVLFPWYLYCYGLSSSSGISGRHHLHFSMTSCCRLWQCQYQHQLFILFSEAVLVIFHHACHHMFVLQLWTLFRRSIFLFRNLLTLMLFSLQGKSSMCFAWFVQGTIITLGAHDHNKGLHDLLHNYDFLLFVTLLWLYKFIYSWNR
jgi:hypothetical protein